MSYEKDKLDSYVTSASLSTALAPYVTSNSLSAAIAGINLAPYMTSNSISAAVATDALTVRGAASVSATMSAAAITLAGRPVGAVLLGVDTQTNGRNIRFSGSWSDFIILDLQVFCSGGGGTFPLSIYTDGGTTPILVSNLNANVTTGRGFAGSCRVAGGNGQAAKVTISTFQDSSDIYYSAMSRTANSGFVNALTVTMTFTASVIFSALYGWRQS